MALTILEILDLAPPLEVWTAAFNEFAIFYVEAEDLITAAQNRYTEFIDLYDIILAEIDNSLLSDSRGTKTWLTEAYELGKTTSHVDNFYYNEKIVPFVGDLQELVLVRYDSLDDFYDEFGITVSQVFADLSEAAGYPISAQYIEDIS